MSWAEDTKLRLQIVAVGMALMCPAFLIWLAPETFRQFASESWPSAPGVVQTTRAVPWRDSDNVTMYYGTAIYEYVVDGQKYTSDLTELGSRPKRSDPNTALADVSEYTAGMSVPVYFDPADPQIAVIKRGINAVRLGLLIGLAIGSVFGLAVTAFTVRQLYRMVHQKRAAKAFRTVTQQGAPPTNQPSVSLGEPIEMFRPKQINVIAGYILTAILFGGALLLIGFPLHGAYQANWKLPFDVKKGWSWLAVGLMTLLGLGVMVGACAMAFYARWLASHQLEVGANGFRRISRSSRDEVLWSEVDRITTCILYERPPILKGPLKLLLPQIASKSYQILTKSGQEHAFDGNDVNNLPRLEALLQQQAQSRGIPWGTVELKG